ncbi:hypothetical protein ACOME3_000658 [Neoechinorhynchus agilis]
MTTTISQRSSDYHIRISKLNANDINGYFKQTSEVIIAFVNTKSGGQRGKKVIGILGDLIGKENVYPLDSREGFRPEDILRRRLYENVHFRIIAAGGDGTAAWMFYALDEARGLTTNSIAILPLGTGNDMAGFLKWGYGGMHISNASLSNFINAIICGQIIKIDRWNLRVKAKDFNQNFINTSTVVERELPYDVFNNYLSIGADASVALRFHQQRNKNIHPRINKVSRLSNRVQYANYYIRKFVSAKMGERKSLDKYVSLECDGRDMQDRLSYLKPDVILFLNISSYAGGCQPWGNEWEFSRIPYFEKWLKQRCNDGFMEVIAFTMTEWGNLALGGRGHRLCQCRKARLETQISLPMKVDGEPVMIAPCVIEIDWRNFGLGIRNVVRGGYCPLSMAEPIDSLSGYDEPETRSI